MYRPRPEHLIHAARPMTTTMDTNISRSSSIGDEAQTYSATQVWTSKATSSRPEHLIHERPGNERWHDDNRQQRRNKKLTFSTTKETAPRPDYSISNYIKGEEERVTTATTTLKAEKNRRKNDDFKSGATTNGEQLRFSE